MKRISTSPKPITLILVLAWAVFLVLIFAHPADVFTQGKKLTGAEVYSANCGKCHSERYPSERTDEEWRLIVNHMRVRAGLTAQEAKAVLEYLQENND